MQGVDWVLQSERWGWQMACWIKPKKTENEFYPNFYILCLNISIQIALIFSYIYTINCTEMSLLWFCSTSVNGLAYKYIGIRVNLEFK